MDAPQSGIYHFRRVPRYPKSTAREIFSGENAPHLDGRASSPTARRSLSRRSPRSGREMGHLRRPRIDVQIGGPFTQQLAASDTLAPSPYPEHKMKEEEGDLAFPHKED